ncbi:MAG: hypothetical protein ACFNYD_08795, partial [Bacteroides sp.]
KGRITDAAHAGGRATFGPPLQRRWRGERPYKNDAALVRAGICGWAGNSRPAPTTLFLRNAMDVYVYGGGGRGNLHENREDPAPTVGVGGDVYPIKNDAALVGRALATLGSAPTKSATAKLDSAPLRFRLTLTS